MRATPDIGGITLSSRTAFSWEDPFLLDEQISELTAKRDALKAELAAAS